MIMSYNIRHDIVLFAGLLSTCFMTCQLQSNQDGAPIPADTVFAIPDAYSGFDSALSCAYEKSDSAQNVVSTAINEAKRSRVPVIFETPRKDTAHQNPIIRISPHFGEHNRKK